MRQSELLLGFWVILRYLNRIDEIGPKRQTEIIPYF
jgi:hypothetical protein